MHSPHDASFDALEARIDRLTRAVLAFGVTYALSQAAVIVTVILRT